MVSITLIRVYVFAFLGFIETGFFMTAGSSYSVPLMYNNETRYIILVYFLFWKIYFQEFVPQDM